MQHYRQEHINNNVWVVYEEGHDYKQPLKTCATFAFDTETLVLLDGKVKSQEAIFKALRNVSTADKRRRLSNIVWAWQVYDEVNGFFMTNDFSEFMTYISRCGFKFGWCYNATFDFAQIDYQLLGVGRDKWKPHERRTGKAYNKNQPYTYESIHNDSGARYAYKLWWPYKQVKDRHTYVHSVDIRDFMKLLTGGLAKVLEDLDVRDNDGQPIRKLTMEYQDVDQNNLKEDEIAYCCNDVKGLYFAIKKFNETIEAQSNNECHIYGKDTNIMTAGGLAKRLLLQSLYPNTQPRYRIERYQKQHPITEAQDKYLRDNHLYRGGISYVNPRYKGKLLTAYKMRSPMYRYDVNSEYPYAMASIRDLVGKPRRIPYEQWANMKEEEQEGYECIYMLKGITGTLKPNMLGVWYDPFKKDFVDYINEKGLHLIYERELYEYAEWYDIEYEIDEVIIIKRGNYVYKPFVDKNYELKAQAKRELIKTLQMYAKLILNSSYGKLAERVERGKGHYELNEETNAIHFVEDGVEVDTKSMLSVLVGALVTTFARCYILGKIREVCDGNPSKNFVYIDTDSIHAFSKYDKADAYALGGLKLEAICKAVKYIAPKTYIDIEEVKNGIIPLNDKGKYPIEVHAKGINIKVVLEDFYKRKKLTLKYVSGKINYGTKYVCLVAMNVQGGKVLVPTEKYIARKELDPNYDKLFLNNSTGGNYINER